MGQGQTNQWSRCVKGVRDYDDDDGGDDDHVLDKYNHMNDVHHGNDVNDDYDDENDDDNEILIIFPYGNIDN